MNRNSEKQIRLGRVALLLGGILLFLPLSAPASAQYIMVDPDELEIGVHASNPLASEAYGLVYAGMEITEEIIGDWLLGGASGSTKASGGCGKHEHVCGAVAVAAVNWEFSSTIEGEVLGGWLASLVIPIELKVDIAGAFVASVGFAGWHANMDYRVQAGNEKEHENVECAGIGVNPQPLPCFETGASADDSGGCTRASGAVSVGSVVDHWSRILSVRGSSCSGGAPSHRAISPLLGSDLHAGVRSEVDVSRWEPGTTVSISLGELPFGFQERLRGDMYDAIMAEMNAGLQFDAGEDSLPELVALIDMVHGQVSDLVERSLSETLVLRLELPEL